MVGVRTAIQQHQRSHKSFAALTHQENQDLALRTGLPQVINFQASAAHFAKMDHQRNKADLTSMRALALYTSVANIYKASIDASPDCFAPAMDLVRETFPKSAGFDKDNEHVLVLLSMHPDERRNLEAFKDARKEFEERFQVGSMLLALQGTFGRGVFAVLSTSPNWKSS